MQNPNEIERSSRMLRHRDNKRWWISLGVDYIVTRFLIVVLIAAFAGQVYRAATRPEYIPATAAARAAQEAVISVTRDAKMKRGARAKDTTVPRRADPRV
ncbi:MAG: hypothetical protein ABI333_24980 [bacterium]